jgi:hypothetical protein
MVTRQMPSLNNRRRQVRQPLDFPEWAAGRTDAPVFAPRNLDGNSHTQFQTPFFRIENDGPVPRTIFGETPSKTPLKNGSSYSYDGISREEAAACETQKAQVRIRGRISEIRFGCC